MRQHPESQCFVVLQCLRSTATTPCLKFFEIFDVESFFQKKLKTIDRKAFNFTYPHVLFFMSHADMYTFPSEPQTGPIPDIPLAPDVFTDPLPIMLDKMSDRRN